MSDGKDWWKTRLIHSRENSLLPEELANQGVRLKEEQLRREEEKVIVYTVKVCGWLTVVGSFARRNCGCRGRSTRRSRSCWRRRRRCGRQTLLLLAGVLTIWQESREPACKPGGVPGVTIIIDRVVDSHVSKLILIFYDDDNAA